jgi:SAM-dependent MidA family methyltransferase
VSFLRAKIEQEIRENGPIPFSRYMELCLYDSEFGYYSRTAEQFGKAGDFYTSSDVHAVFGRLLARQFEEMWRVLGSPAKIQLIELGPGRGLFAQDVLAWSENKFPDCFRALRYRLVESSSVLRNRIRSTLAHYLESGKAELAAIVNWPEPGKGTTAVSQPALSEPAERRELVGTGNKRALASEVPVILFANEFFDALPVEVLSDRGTLRIDSRDGRFVETWAPPSAEQLRFLDQYSIHPEAGERVEVALAAEHSMQNVAESLDRGFAVIIDYGYTREEQLAGRHRGTLKAIRQHSISASPYEAPGEQDITADVNFTALAAAAQKHKLDTRPLITQSRFLMGIGEANQFADAFEECRRPQERTKVALQLKHLVTPAGVGESFHVLMGSKGIEAEVADSLSGLSFARSLIR